jgi:4-hydroxybenzoate polyprenyltransferase
MAVNRIADRHLDALNPRTANRALPRGQVRVAEAAALAAGGFALLLLAAWMLNPLCGLLAPPAIAVVAGYSYTKRFTILSHLILGLSLALAPLGGWIAVTGRPAWPPAVLGFAVLFWVAGFDVLYALADLEFDRRVGLRSVPASLGVGPSLLVARGCHAATLACLALLPTLLDLGALYLAGWLGAAALLAYEHLLVYRHGLSRLDVAFFNVNGILSVGLFLFTLGDLLWGR